MFYPSALIRVVCSGESDLRLCTLQHTEFVFRNMPYMVTWRISYKSWPVPQSHPLCPMSFSQSLTTKTKKQNYFTVPWILTTSWSLLVETYCIRLFTSGFPPVPCPSSKRTKYMNLLLRTLHAPCSKPYCHYQKRLSYALDSSVLGLKHLMYTSYELWRTYHFCGLTPLVTLQKR